MKVKAILQRQIESFKDYPYLNTWKITKLNCWFAYLFELLSSPIVFSVFIFYICSYAVTTVQNNIVFGVVIVQRSAHIYIYIERERERERELF